MNIEQIQKAETEAKRFIKAAREAEQRISNDFFAYYEKSGVGPEKNMMPWTVTSRETAACRRASMDLTRALADLRRY